MHAFVLIVLCEYKYALKLCCVDEKKKKREKERRLGAEIEAVHLMHKLSHFLIIMVGLLYDPAFCLFLLLYIVYDYIRVMIDAKG